MNRKHLILAGHFGDNSPTSQSLDTRRGQMGREETNRYALSERRTKLGCDMPNEKTSQTPDGVYACRMRLTKLGRNYCQERCKNYENCLRGGQ